MQRQMVVSCAVLLALWTSSCRPAATPSTTPTNSPTIGPVAVERLKPRVVVLAFDGARPDWIFSDIQDGTMPNLAALARRGVTAEHLQSVDPALAVTAYASLSTGSFPNQTGVVSDRYHVPQDAFHEPADPLSQRVSAAEPIWRLAMRQGLKTAVLFWPGALLDVPEQHADYMVAIASSDVPAAQHAVTFQEAQGWDAPPHSFSPLREGTLRITGGEGSTVASYALLAVDGTDDNAGNYDTLIVDADKNLANGSVTLGMGKWAPVVVSPRLQSGAYLCFTASSNVSATVYASQVSYTQAYPDGLLRTINPRLGFPSPAPDATALHDGWISPQQYFDMAELRAKWMMDAVLQVYETLQPDVLLTTQDIIADCARAFLLVDERQEGYSPERASQYASYLEKAHKTADDSLGRLLQQVNLADSAVFVLSGEGLAPVHTAVRLNTILKGAGLLQLKTVSGQDEVDDGKSKALAFASGGSAHIYVNLQGRERLGLVAPEELDKVQKQIVQALQETKGTDGQPVFARILKREELKAAHLDSPNSGDVFVQAAPGYCLSDELGFRKTLTAPMYRAAAGFDAALPEMHGFFIAAGDGLAAGVKVPPVQAIDVAPTLAKLLSIPFANTLSGQPVDGIWR